MEARLMQVPPHCKLAWYIKKDEYESLEFESEEEGCNIVDQMFRDEIITKKEKRRLKKIIRITNLKERKAVVYTKTILDIQKLPTFRYN